MATVKQIQANRLNAQKSTGPRSLEGKAVSRMNALKSGIHAESMVISGESAEELAALTAEYYDHYQPVAPEERLWLDTLIRNEWLLRRLFLAESQAWEYGLHRLNTAWKESTGGRANLGYVANTYEETFTRLQRRLDATQRHCARAQEQLERLQKLRREAEPVPDAAPPEPPTPAESVAPVEIGFVPSLLPQPPAPARGSQEKALTNPAPSQDLIP